MDLPDEFWLSIRHISSFSNKAKYDIYLKQEIEKWLELKNT